MKKDVKSYLLLGKIYGRKIVNYIHETKLHQDSVFVEFKHRNSLAASAPVFKASCSSFAIDFC
jgi:hypothetical protein